ncbi:S-adenosyl-L-methionine-dependent methyltransferase [Apiosordaria backusii]|uniref:S-adenosyl-L-methionine-dependent methyltransferase n=1 Tax=Apiosordaria backusii TaxID=314023 RepID=A0AA40DXE1_9PEZI|nr:S-adenosyl-L-methionine-dependent methyltransferase [Apiosordaria backusii]
MMATPRILELASSILSSVTIIHDALVAKQIPLPSFDEDAPERLPHELSDAGDAVLDATAELRDLLLCPISLLHKHSSHNSAVYFQAISRSRIPSLIPPKGRISFAEIANKTTLPEQIITRLLRYAMTFHVFCEPEPGMVAHTKASKALLDADTNDWLRTGTEEMFPAATRLLDAVQKWPNSQEPNETAFCLANNTSQSIYEVLASDPGRAKRFSATMRVLATKPENDPCYITDYYDWAALGPNAHIVDIGGGHGHVSKAIASKFPNIAQVTVQDIPGVVDGAEAGVPEQLKGRIFFQAYDMFSPQTVQADVYIFRWVLHNWPDKYCIMALKAQIPVLKAGSIVLIQDTLLPEPGTGSRWREQGMRSTDLIMAVSFNSRERTVAEWKALLTEADPRFAVKTVTEPKGSALGILVVEWAG